MTLEQLLYTIAFGFLVFLVFLWSIIGYSVIIRTLRNKTRSKIDDFFIEKLTIEYAKSAETTALTHFDNNFSTSIRLKNKRKLQYASNILIRVQDIFQSENQEMIAQLCKENGIAKAVRQKIHKRNWYPKAMAIWLSYELDLKDHLDKIQPFTSHKNILVRREAQIALVRFSGWKSLKMLLHLKYPMSLWQQIRIIEKLMDYHPIPDVTYIDAALKTENPYSMELLIRLIRRFDLKSYAPYIIEQLQHPNPAVSETALEILETFQLNAAQLQKLEAQLTQCSQENQQLKITQLIALQRAAITKESRHGNS